MHIIKNVCKVIARNWPVLAIYIGVFMFFFFSMAQKESQTMTKEFMSIRQDIIVINQDEGNAFSDSFLDYLKTIHNVNTDYADEEIAEDAVSSGEQYLLLVIPEGFGDDFVSNTHELTIKRVCSKQASIEQQIEMQLNKYFEISRIYIGTTGEDGVQSDEQIRAIAENVKNDISSSVETSWKGSDVSVSFENASRHFTFFAYAALGICILGTYTIFKAFRSQMTAARIRCAPIKNAKMTFLIFVGSLTFLGLIFLGLIAICASSMFDDMSNPRIWMLIINALVFYIVCLSLGLLISALIRNENLMTFVSNAASLGLCFISGVFVDQTYLATSVKTIASFMPVYWYVRAINLVKEATSLSGDALSKIILCIGIQLGFAVVLFTLSLVITKQKRLNA